MLHPLQKKSAIREKMKNTAIKEGKVQSDAKELALVSACGSNGFASFCCCTFFPLPKKKSFYESFLCVGVMFNF